jgi:hypothetical protein
MPPVFGGQRPQQLRIVAIFALERVTGAFRLRPELLKGVAASVSFDRARLEACTFMFSKAKRATVLAASMNTPVAQNAAPIANAPFRCEEAGLERAHLDDPDGRLEAVRHIAKRTPLPRSRSWRDHEMKP